MMTDDEKMIEKAVAEMMEQILKMMPQATVNNVAVVTIPVDDIQYMSETLGHEIAVAITSVATAFISNLAAEIAEGAKNSIQRWIATSKID